MDIFWDFALRLFVAGAMGVLIGLEREYRAKEAGSGCGIIHECTDMPGYDNTAEWAYRYASIPICYLPKFQFLMICSISSFISFVMLFCVLGWKARNLLAALWNLSGCKKEGFVYNLASRK